MTQARKCLVAARKAPGCCPGLEEFLSPEFFQALCDPSRLGILARMAVRGGAATVSRIADGLPIGISVVSRHLATLRRAGIIEAERKGKEVHYRVRYEVLVRTLRAIADAVEACCPPPNMKKSPRKIPPFPPLTKGVRGI